jgi:glutathione S-transferase
MPTHDALFHEYALSPFSEKVRRIFGFKKMAYRSVEQPMWMPKPQLTPLTGGYRRIPVQQVGADVYCDTALIARHLEARQPAPTIFPAGQEAAARLVAAWADRQLFQACVPLVFGALAEVMPPELLADRQKMRPDLNVETLRAAAPHCRSTLHAALATLDDGLATNDFVLGGAFSVADAAIYHCLWFVRNAPECAAMLDSARHVGAWMARLNAMGPGERSPMDAAEALAIATAASPAATPATYAADPHGLTPGQTIGISSDDLPSDVFRGAVVTSGPDEIVIRRDDPALGALAIHFPRAGYLIHAGV